MLTTTLLTTDFSVFSLNASWTEHHDNNKDLIRTYALTNTAPVIIEENKGESKQESILDSF